MKKIILLSALSISLALAACNKDEDCGHKTFEEYVLAPTDVEDLGLFGKVKQYTSNYWNGCRWENNAVVTGYIYDKDEYTFNEAGYILTYKNWSALSGDALALYTNYQYTYDSRNRISTQERLNQSGDIYLRTTYSYNDTDKTATAIDYTNEDGNWKELETTVYQLNKYGHIDYRNYNIVDPETRGDKGVAKYDSYGNRTESYTLYDWGGSDKSISSYRTYKYEYYK